MLLLKKQTNKKHTRKDQKINQSTNLLCRVFSGQIYVIMSRKWWSWCFTLDKEAEVIFFKRSEFCVSAFHYLLVGRQWLQVPFSWLTHWNTSKRGVKWGWYPVQCVLCPHKPHTFSGGDPRTKKEAGWNVWAATVTRRLSTERLGSPTVVQPCSSLGHEILILGPHSKPAAELGF